MSELLNVVINNVEIPGEIIDRIVMYLGYGKENKNGVIEYEPILNDENRLKLFNMSEEEKKRLLLGESIIIRGSADLFNFMNCNKLIRARYQKFYLTEEDKKNNIKRPFNVYQVNRTCGQASGAKFIDILTKAPCFVQRCLHVRQFGTVELDDGSFETMRFSDNSNLFLRFILSIGERKFREICRIYKDQTTIDEELNFFHELAIKREEIKQILPKDLVIRAIPDNFVWKKDNNGMGGYR
jgi:hypothetical protein